MSYLTRSEVIQRVRYAMGVLNIKDHLPTFRECLEHGKLSGADLRAAGGLKTLSALMHLPMANRMPKDKNEDMDDGIYTMEDVTPSKAFEIQKVSGELWAETQKRDTLSKVPAIDLTAYAGMKTFAERMEDGLRRY